MEKRYRLELLGITYNQIESGVYALILQQSGGTRRIPIIIGFPEAQAIECRLQSINPPRPLTHDTMVNTLESFGIRLVEVEIKKLPDGIFAADLIFSDGINRSVIDSRSSDAIALAIRTGAPIYTSESVLEEAGFEPGEMKARESRQPSIKETVKETTVSSLEKMTMEQLSEAMMKASEAEDYEEAAKIKAEIDKRNNDV